MNEIVGAVGAVQQSVPLEIRKGTELRNRFVFIEVCGSGGYGTVWRATDKQENRDVAIKRLLRKGFAYSQSEIDAFLEEGKNSAKLRGNKNIVEVYDAFQEGNDAFIVMEYVDGSSLESLLREHVLKGTWIDPDDALDYFKQVLSGLVLAHSSGIYHRDVKPSNILISRLGVVKLVDFGLAKPLPYSLREQQDAALGLAHSGTPSFMSFEQARGEKLDQQTDIFSAGIIGHILFTGRHPFNHPSGLFNIFDLIKESGFSCPRMESKPEVPDVVRTTIERMLMKDRAKRYQSLLEPLAELTKEDAQACSTCGTVNPAKNKFCGECGRSLQPTPDSSINARGVSSAPRTAEALTDEGYELTKRSDWEGAIKNYREAIRLDPKHSRAFSNLGFALNKQGRYLEAIDVLTRGIETTQEAVLLHRMFDSRGFAKSSSKQYAEAIEDYTRAIQINPMNPRVFYHRADSRAQLGEIAEAYEDVERSLELDPDYTAAHRLKARLGARW